MANTYAEVSTKYIIPGVSKIDRLSLPDAKEISAEERAQKIAEVGELAIQARKGVKLLANAVCPFSYSLSLSFFFLAFPRPEWLTRRVTTEKGPISHGHDGAARR